MTSWSEISEAFYPWESCWRGGWKHEQGTKPDPLLIGVRSVRVHYGTSFMFREGLDIVGARIGSPVHTSGVGTVILSPGRLGWCLSAAAWWKRWEQVAEWIQWSLFASDASLLLHEMIENILETASFWWQLHEFCWCFFFRHMTDHCKEYKILQVAQQLLDANKNFGGQFFHPNNRPWRRWVWMWCCWVGKVLEFSGIRISPSKSCGKMHSNNCRWSYWICF